MRNQLLFMALLAMTLPLVACKDYGEFAVAERQWVDNDELPALSEMDLTGINLEFAVGSEAHARVLPEADWPDPVGALMDRVKRENGGEVPADFDLPLEDGCIYVGLEPRFSRFRRVEFQGRMLLFVTYLVSLENSSQNEGGATNGVRFEPRLAVIDESMGMKRYDLQVDSLQFQIVQTDSIFGIISTRNRSIHLRKLYFRDNTLAAKEPVRLAYSGQRADKMVIAPEPNGAFHLAWLTERYAAMPERFVYYAYFSQDGITEQSAVLLSDSAVNSFLSLVVHDSQPLVIWTDARFVWRGFKTTNKSKIMVGSADAMNNEYWPPIVLNTPKDNSDNAHRPWLASPNGDIAFFAWGTTSAGNWRDTSLQLALLNLESRSLKLAKTTDRFQNIAAEANRQELNHQRNMSIAGLPVPDPAECDQWRERLNLKPTGFGVMTPEGEREFMKLDPEKNDDNGQD